LKIGNKKYLQKTHKKTSFFGTFLSGKKYGQNIKSAGSANNLCVPLRETKTIARKERKEKYAENAEKHLSFKGIAGRSPQ
jgi:hypothetical protein